MDQEHCLKPARLCAARRQGMGWGEVNTIHTDCSEDTASELCDAVVHPTLQTNPLRGEPAPLWLASVGWPLRVVSGGLACGFLTTLTPAVQRGFVASSPRALWPWVELRVHTASELQCPFPRCCDWHEALWIGCWPSFPTGWQPVVLLHSLVPCSRVALWHSGLIALADLPSTGSASCPNPTLEFMVRSPGQGPLPSRFWLEPILLAGYPKIPKSGVSRHGCPPDTLGLLGCSLYTPSPKVLPLSGDWVLRPDFRLILGSGQVSIQSSMLLHLWQVSLEKYFRKNFIWSLQATIKEN